MRPRDWFLVAVRVLGLWVFYCGFVDLIYFGAILLGLGPHSLVEKEYVGSAEKASMTYLWYGAGRFALALYFLFRAEGLTKWVFGERPRDDEQSNGEA